MRRSGLTIILKLIGMISSMLHVMIAAIIMGIIGFICAIFIPILAAKSIANILETGNIGTWIIWTMIGMALLRGVLRYAEQAANHYIAFKILAMIRHKIFNVLRKLAPAKLEGRDRGNLISLITSDIELLEVFYAHTISPIIIAILTSGIMIYFINRYSSILAIIAAIAYVIVGVIIPITFSKLGKDAGMKYRNDFGDINTYFLDNLRGLSENIQYNVQDKRLEEVNKKTDVLNEEQKKIKRHEGITRSVTTFTVITMDFIVIITALYLCLHGELSFESVLVSTIALMSSFGPVIALSNLSNSLLLTLASGDRVLNLLEEKPQLEDVKGKETTIFGDIQCNNINFSYGEELILNDLSLEIPKNRIVGIKGKSGSGKSTLLKLIMRFWDVNSGSINISNKNIKDINTFDLRNMESYVTQSTHIFPGTIMSNIAISRPNASLEEVKKAARKASIDEFIEKLPDGYYTKTADLGDNFSGGERQRIGIARAFLYNSPLILLDEPTSNLDSLNEGIILKSLSEESKDKTIILVSHRESTMKIAEDVYHMDNSRLS